MYDFILIKQRELDKFKKDHEARTVSEKTRVSHDVHIKVITENMKKYEEKYARVKADYVERLRITVIGRHKNEIRHFV